MRSAAAALALAACATGPKILARGTLAYDVAAGGPLVATIELDTAFRLVLRASGTTRSVELGPPDRDFVHLAVDGAGTEIAVAGLDGTVRLFGADGTERDRWRLDAAATAVALSADGRYLIHGAASGVLCLRRAEDGALLQCVVAHDGRVTGLAIDGDVLVSTGADGRAIVWSLPSLRVVASHAAGAPIQAAALQGGRVALACGARVLVWRVAGDRVESEAPGTATALIFLPDGRLRTSSARGLALAPDGRTLYVASWTSADLRGASLSAISLP